jgi:O-antigen/teichoic acid export membrane protein
MKSLEFSSISQLRYRESPDESFCLAPAERSLRLNVSWTFAGNVIYAACQWGMLVVLAKLGSPEMVGQFAFALAVTAPVFMLTNLQLRAVQATDVVDQFVFADYLGLRFLCTALALATIAGIAAFSGHSFTLAAVIFVVGVAKGTESISDAIYGLVQRHERMDLIARSMMLKGSVSLTAFAVTMALTGKLAMGATALAASWCVVLATYDLGLARTFSAVGRRTNAHPGFAPRFRVPTLVRLARLCLPLGFTATLASLTLNVPRYFIEHFSGARALGFFAAIAYLMVACTLVTHAIGQSAAPKLASRHASGNISAFRALLLKLCGIAAAPGIAGILVAILAGKTVLRMVYRADYASYSHIFVLLMIAATIFGAASILEYGMTAARILKPQPTLFAAMVVASIAACFLWVPTYGLEGAAFSLIFAASTQLVGSLLGQRQCEDVPW